jgi:protein O-mannosyl-transferase
MPPSDSLKGNAYQVGAVCAVLLLAAALVFGQTVHHEFINLDDTAYVYMNPHVTDGLSWPAVQWAFTARYAGAWMPLTWITHMVDCQIYGLNAGGHHLTNVLLHGASAVLLFLVLRQMTGRLWPSAFVAAVFAVHPLRVESVAWVTERKDVLSGLFFMLALAAYVGYACHRFSFVRYAAVIVPFALGLMAKPILVTLPFLLLLLDYWPLRRWSAPNAVRLLLEKVPLVALSALSCALAVWGYGSEGVNLLDQRYDLSWRVGNVPLSYVSYLGMFFYPANLAIPYPRPGLDLPLWKISGAVLLLILLTLAALVAGRRRPYLPVGWLWYVGMLVPVSGVFQFGMQTMADRFTYLPQIGLCLGLTWALADALESSPSRRAVYGVAAALVLAILTGCAWRQTSFWRDDLTLWNHTLACTSRNRLAHHALGNTYLRLGRIDEAIEQYRAALAIEPDYAMSHYNLGVALAAVGRLDEAMEHYRTSAQLQPKDAMSHYNLGVALAAVGRLDEAIEQYEKTVELQPDYVGAHNNLGCALYARGRLDMAMSHFRKALEVDPQSADAHLNVGTIWRHYGELDKAIAEYQQALRLNPDLPWAHFALGAAFAKRGDLDLAIAEYRRALEGNPPFAVEVHNSLGLALAARGKPDEAVVHYRRALAIDPGFVKARRNLAKVLSGASGASP